MMDIDVIGPLRVNTRRYTLVHGLCFFKLFFSGGKELSGYENFSLSVAMTTHIAPPYPLPLVYTA